MHIWHYVIHTGTPDICLAYRWGRQPKFKMSKMKLEVELTVERKQMAKRLQRLPPHFQQCLSRIRISARWSPSSWTRHGLVMHARLYLLTRSDGGVSTKELPVVWYKGPTGHACRATTRLPLVMSPGLMARSWRTYWRGEVEHVVVDCGNWTEWLRTTGGSGEMSCSCTVERGRLTTRLSLIRLIL